jgi:two-component system sensor histidine kinase KdpD
VHTVRHYALALLVAGLCTVANWVLSAWLQPTNLAIVYLLGIVLIAVRGERGPAIVGAIASVLAFDYCFVPPVLSFRFGDKQYLLTALGLVTVGLIVSTLASRARSQMRAAGEAALAAREERLRNSLLASLSHDLRTPLAVIVGSASSLRENRSKLSEPEQDQLLTTVHDEAQRMSLVVSDLLDMTRLHAGPVSLDRQWYPIEELMGAALERCKPVLADCNVRTHLPEGLPMVHVDGVLFEKLLVNLIENAAKYTPPGTAISIAVESAGDRTWVKVQDDGPGFPAGAEHKVFEKFFRVDPEGSAPGSGLGLSICKAIVEMHGGTIEARNRAGGGAEVAFCIVSAQPPPEDVS